MKRCERDGATPALIPADLCCSQVFILSGFHSPDEKKAHQKLPDFTL